ncbi:MAG: GDP-mannose 4,6-dehydratase [Gemmatimonadota bacterium]|nr:GDP-mannose 4,6-dehydratase [Gemmatimonadota bacterium]MDE3216789.1 GDP-mannose 4,6-dehydratase [Gemmatimonadota bacterium]
MKRILVTGGAGFIGSHVADRMLAEGHRVAVVDDLSNGRRENVPAGAEFHELDIRSPEAAALVRGGGFEVIVHLAAQMDVRKSVADPVFDAQVNIAGTLNLLEALRASGRLTATRFLFASTGGAIYGDGVPLPAVEHARKEPDSPYAVAKHSVEQYLSYYGRIHGLPALALRFANVYGPRQDPHGEAGVVAIFCGRVLAGAPLTVFGDGNQTRDYVYVGDVAAAVAAAAHLTPSKSAGMDARAFNVGTGVETSVLDLASALMRAAGRTVPIEFAPARAGEQLRSVLAIDKAAADLGWRPTVSLGQGLAETYAWFAQRSSTSAPTPA